MNSNLSYLGDQSFCACCNLGTCMYRVTKMRTFILAVATMVSHAQLSARPVLMYKAMKMANADVD